METSTSIPTKSGSRVQDGGVYFGDDEEVILNNGYALVGFVVDSVGLIIIIEDKLIEIIFETNSIRIELI